MGDKGEGGVKNLKKSVTPFMDVRKHQTSKPTKTFQKCPNFYYRLAALKGGGAKPNF